jgi:hypothetical protein
VGKMRVDCRRVVCGGGVTGGGAGGDRGGVPGVLGGRGEFGCLEGGGLGLCCRRVGLVGL